MKLGTLLATTPEILKRSYSYDYISDVSSVKYYCDGMSQRLFGGYPYGNDSGAPVYEIFTAKNSGALLYDNGNVVNFTLVYYGLEDMIIQRFINRHIGYTSPSVFLMQFQRKWAENKGKYKRAYDIWNGVYEGAITPDDPILFQGIPIFSDYYKTHELDINTDHTENQTGTHDTTNGTTSTTTTTGTNDGTSTTDSTSKTTNSGTDKTTNTGTVTNSGTNNSTVNTTNSDTSSTENNDRTLNSDTPQSIVNASTTGNPDDISWKYATGLQDAIRNSSGTSNSEGNTTTEGTNSNTTTNDLTSSVVHGAIVDGTGKNSTTYEDNISNKVDYESDITSKSTSTNETTGNNTTAEKGKENAFNNLFSKTAAFLSSSFASYFFEQVYKDFEILFDSQYYLEEYPLYTWKDRLTHVNGEDFYLCDITKEMETDYDNIY